MSIIQQLARTQFGRDVTRKRPVGNYNSSGQIEFDYTTTTDTIVNIVLVKSKKKNNQEMEGVQEVFPAHIFGATDLDIKDFDLICTADDIFQVKNAQLKADNITGTISSNPSYFYCDLTYFDNDLIIE